MSNVVVVSGGFDPIYIGHITKAAELGDELVVIVQNNENLIRKKDFYFMEESERMSVLLHIKGVDHVVLNIDDDMSSIETLRLVRSMYPNKKMIFAKGGDRSTHEIPETPICNELDIEVMDGIGGHLQSSSKLVKRVVDLL